MTSGFDSLVIIKFYLKTKLKKKWLVSHKKITTVEEFIGLWISRLIVIKNYSNMRASQCPFCNVATLARPENKYQHPIFTRLFWKRWINKHRTSGACDIEASKLYRFSVHLLDIFLLLNKQLPLCNFRLLCCWK